VAPRNTSSAINLPDGCADWLVSVGCPAAIGNVEDMKSRIVASAGTQKVSPIGQDARLRPRLERVLRFLEKLILELQALLVRFNGTDSVHDRRLPIGHLKFAALTSGG
jgi:hypothetical protein